MLFILAAFTVWTLAALITESDIAAPIRGWGDHCRKYQGWMKWLTTPLRATHCFYCSSYWAAVPVTAVVYLAAHPTWELALYYLGSIGGAALIERVHMLGEAQQPSPLESGDVGLDKLQGLVDEKLSQMPEDRKGAEPTSDRDAP